MIDKREDGVCARRGIEGVKVYDIVQKQGAGGTGR